MKMSNLPKGFATFATPDELRAHPDGSLLLGGSAGLKRLFRPYQRPRPGVCIVRSTHGDVFSTDPRFNSFSVDLARRASEALPPVVKDGFLEGGAPSDFSALCTVAGLKMDPSNLPPLHNEELLEERKLRLTPSPEMRQIVDAVLYCVHRPRPIAPFRISRISSTTLNRFTSAMPVKQAMIRAILSDPTHVISLAAKGAARELTARYGMFFLYTLVERQQPDRGVLAESSDIGFTPKPRLVRFLNGTYGPADKTTPVNRLGLRGWAARNRTAYAMSGPLAYFVSALRTSYAGYLEEYAFTWKHRSFDQMSEKVANAKVVRGFDATQMDQHVPMWFLDAHAESLAGTTLVPELGKLIKLVNRMGYVAPPMTQDGPLVLAGGLTPSDDTCVGLASGRSDNPDIGKEWMTAVYLDMFYQIYRKRRGGSLEEFAWWLAGTHDLRAAVHAYLNGEGVLKSLNIGDDQLTWTEDQNETWFFDAMDEEESLTTSLSQYVPIEYEKVIMFNGAVLTRDSSGVPRFLPNPVSYLVNWFVPERSAGSSARLFAGVGRKLAQAHYRVNHSIALLDDLVEEIWAHHMGSQYPSHQALIDEDASRFPLTAGTLRDVDLLALNDPSVIHYKVDLKDLSPEVQALLVSSIPPEEFVNMILPFLNPDHKSVFLNH